MHQSVKVIGEDSFDERTESNSAGNVFCSCSKEGSVCYKVPETSIRTGSYVFFLAFIWHIKLLPLFHMSLGKEWLAAIALYPDHVEHFRENLNFSNSDISREFAFMGAITHTVVFVFGLLCATLLKRLRLSYYSANKQRVEPIGIGASLLLILGTATVFHKVAWRLLQYCFETRFGPVFRYANMFFYESGGGSPFAWASSVSYTAALVLGFIISSEEHKSRFERVVLPSETLRAWAVPIIVSFVVWISTLDNVTRPLYNSIANLSSSMIEENEEELPPVCKTVAQTQKESFSAAFVLGLVICTSIPTCCTIIRAWGIFISDIDCVPRANVLTEIKNVFVEVFRTFLLSISFAGLLLTLALYNGEGIFEVEMIFTALANIFFNRELILIGIAAIFSYNFVISLLLGEFTLGTSGSFYLRRAIELILITTLWNCHLIAFFGICSVPFFIWSTLYQIGLITLRSSYLYGDVLWSWFSFIVWGPYGFPVIFHGPVRALSLRMRIPWGIAQETLMALLCLVPLSYYNWQRWVNEAPDFPVYLLMSGINLRYLMTYNDRPEHDYRVRMWPEFREFMNKKCEYIESYFSFQILADHSSINAENFASEKARIFGFHPHGLYPCSVIWIPISPSFRKLFGPRFILHTMTDFFTHITPFMRDLCQWGGGLEVSRTIVKKMLVQNKNIVLVPGGQKEILLHTRENMMSKKIALYAGHKGFVRIALENEAMLIPTFNFGELQNVENINLFPGIQNITRKYLGCPVPFLPVGVYGCLPIPRSEKLSYVIGEPIETKCKLPGKPTEEEVEFYHTKYYTSLRDLINKYKKMVGHGDFEVVLHGFDR